MNRYLEQKILMAEPVELVQMIYQVAINAIRDARAHLRDQKIRERTRAINHAFEAISELNVALDPEAAPEMAARLRSLYLYMQRRLIEANAEKDDAPLAEILGLLQTLSEGWAGVAQTAEGKQHRSQRDNLVFMHPVATLPDGAGEPPVLRG